MRARGGCILGRAPHHQRQNASAPRDGPLQGALLQPFLLAKMDVRLKDLRRADSEREA